MIRTTIAVDPDTFAAAVVQADREGTTLSAWARALLALATTDRRLAAKVRRRIERERRRAARSAVKRSRR